jgi:preprotein translocase subunit SecA
MPQIKHVYETMSDRFKNIVFPLSDGRKELQLIVNLEDAYKSNGKNIAKQFEKHVILGIIDNEWKEHLREMDDLRSAVNNATYEQKDPLVVYKLESYDLFKNMLNRVNEEVVELLMNLDIPNEPALTSTNQESTQNHYSQGKANVSNSGSASQFQGSQGYQEAVENSMQQPEKKIPVVAEQKINRNDPCPCGSGKKYKQCHGK